MQRVLAANSPAAFVLLASVTRQLPGNRVIKWEEHDVRSI